jgi:hypothetical protein
VPIRWPVDIRMLVACYVLLVIIAGCLAILRPFGAGTKVTRAELGAEWPLTISEGTLRCEFRGEIILQHRGTGYSLTRHDAHGAYTDVAAIQADDINGGKKDLTTLIERGSLLCD